MQNTFFNFNQELMKSISNNDNKTSNDNICLISGDILDKNECVTLPCNHNFNYKDIYYEVIYQKKNLNLDSLQIMCPYCKTRHNTLLPTTSKFPKIKFVNFPIKYCLGINKCKYVFKTGKKQGELCNKFCESDYCATHSYSKCDYVFKKGKRKGQLCNARCCDNKSKCSKHNK